MTDGLRIIFLIFSVNSVIGAPLIDSKNSVKVEYEFDVHDNGYSVMLIKLNHLIF